MIIVLLLSWFDPLDGSDTKRPEGFCSPGLFSPQTKKAEGGSAHLGFRFVSAVSVHQFLSLNSHPG
jgi:hypothetical protein